MGALGPDATHRMLQPVLGIDDLGCMLATAADHTQWMPFFRLDRLHLAIAETHLHPAASRTDTTDTTLPFQVYLDRRFLRCSRLSDDHLPCLHADDLPAVQPSIIFEYLSSLWGFLSMK